MRDSGPRGFFGGFFQSPSALFRPLLLRRRISAEQLRNLLRAQLQEPLRQLLRSARRSLPRWRLPQRCLPQLRFPRRWLNRSAHHGRGVDAAGKRPSRSRNRRTRKPRGSPSLDGLSLFAGSSTGSCGGSGATCTRGWSGAARVVAHRGGGEGTHRGAVYRFLTLRDALRFRVSSGLACGGGRCFGGCRVRRAGDDARVGG